MKKQILYILLSLFAPSLFAQQELGLHFLTSVWQSQETQPAYFSPKHVVVTLPSTYYNASNSGFTINKLFAKDGDSLSVNSDGVMASVKSQNYMRGNVSIAPIGLGLRFGNLQFGFSSAIKSSGYLNYNQELAGLFLKGNGKYVGQTVNVGPDFAFTAYSEIGISGAYRFLKYKDDEEGRLAIGLKLKYLNGIADFSVSKDHRQASIYTDPEYYAITLKTDYEIQSSMITKGDSLKLQLTADSLKAFTNNGGWGIDLGATFKITDKWSVSASMIDLGEIYWNQNTKTYKSQGEYKYGGVTFNQLIKDGDKINFQALSDTLRATFKFNGTDAGNYKTALHTKYYISTTFKPLSFLRVGGLLYGEMFHKKMNPALALSGNFDWKLASIGITGAYRNGRVGNLGLNAALKLGWFQMYFASDNLAGIIAPKAVRNGNLRGGINLVF